MVTEGKNAGNPDGLPSILTHRKRKSASENQSSDYSLLVKQESKLMNKYETPIIEKQELDAIDVISTSGEENLPDELITKGSQIGNIDSNQFSMFN